MLFESSKWILMQMPHTCDTYRLVNNWHTSIKSSKNSGNSRSTSSSSSSTTIQNDNDDETLSRITVFNWVIQLISHKRTAFLFLFTFFNLFFHIWCYGFNVMSAWVGQRRKYRKRFPVIIWRAHVKKTQRRRTPISFLMRLRIIKNKY